MAVSVPPAFTDIEKGGLHCRAWLHHREHVRGQRAEQLLGHRSEDPGAEGGPDLVCRRAPAEPG